MGEKGSEARSRLAAVRGVGRPGLTGPPLTVGRPEREQEAHLVAAETEQATPVAAQGLTDRVVRPTAALAAVGLALVVGGVAWLRSGGGGETVQLAPRSSASSSAASSTASSAASSTAGAAASLVPGAPVTGAAASVVVVDVEGRVRHPGLRRLPGGARVADAVRAAGGTTSGAVLTALNLARVLGDGEQILVPGPGDPVPPPAPGGSSGGSGGPSGGAPAAGPVDLNAATQEGLDALPGVGPVLAGRIIAWRTQHGRFTSVDELGEVPGIGPKALERLRPLVRV